MFLVKWREKGVGKPDCAQAGLSSRCGKLWEIQPANEPMAVAASEALTAATSVMVTKARGVC